MQQGMRAKDISPNYQSMSAATLAGSSDTPSTPTKTRVASLTPIPIPGANTPRKVTPSRQWTLKDPLCNPTQPGSTPVAKSYVSTNQNPDYVNNTPQKPISKQPEPSKGLFDISAWPGTTGSPATPQPLKGILKTPDCGRDSDGNKPQPSVQSKSRKKKRNTPVVSWSVDTKYSHASS
ncbi:hypothetical protein VTH82DRAFT_6427 [Thermothelomyces myriococcoides]